MPRIKKAAITLYRAMRHFCVNWELCLETTIHLTGGLSKARAKWSGGVGGFYDWLALHSKEYITDCGGISSEKYDSRNKNSGKTRRGAV